MKIFATALFLLLLPLESRWANAGSDPERVPKHRLTCDDLNSPTSDLRFSYSDMLEKGENRSIGEQEELLPDFEYCNEEFYHDRTAAPGILSLDTDYFRACCSREGQMTCWKATYYCAFAAVIAGIAAAQWQYGISDYVIEAIKYNSFILLFFAYFIDPLSSLIDLSLAQYPEINKKSLTRTEARDRNREIALVIPAHNSAEIIRKTITAALRHLRPEQIFIVDNGKGPNPSDNTEEVVRRISPKIHYIWQAIPNKTVAQYAGTKAAEKLGFKFIMTTDDDVRLPTHFDFGTHRLNNQIKAIAFLVRAVAPDGKPSILAKWQDIEYQGSDLTKMAEDRFDSAQYPHGAGSLWETQTFLKILRDYHDTIFYAEDMKLGFGLSRLGKKMAVSATETLDTDVPTSIWGRGPNYWSQRVRSWEMTRHFMFFRILGQLFNCCCCGAPSEGDACKNFGGFLIKKKNQGVVVLSTVADWIRFPIILVLASNPGYWVQIGLFNAASLSPPLLLNYGGRLDHRPDLRINPLPIITYPLYKVIYQLVSVAGAVRTLFIYLPNLKKHDTIRDLEIKNDHRCVWLKNEGIFRDDFEEDLSPQ